MHDAAMHCGWVIVCLGRRNLLEKDFPEVIEIRQGTIVVDI